MFYKQAFASQVVGWNDILLTLYSIVSLFSYSITGYCMNFIDALTAFETGSGAAVKDVLKVLRLPVLFWTPSLIEGPFQQQHCSKHITVPGCFLLFIYISLDNTITNLCYPVFHHSDKTEYLCSVFTQNWTFFPHKSVWSNLKLQASCKFHHSQFPSLHLRVVCRMWVTVSVFGYQRKLNSILVSTIPSSTKAGRPLVNCQLVSLCPNSNL